MTRYDLGLDYVGREQKVGRGAARGGVLCLCLLSLLLGLVDSLPLCSVEVIDVA